MNRRKAKPRTALKINDGKGMVIRDTDVSFPSYSQRIKFDFHGKEGALIIEHEYQPSCGYFVSGSIEWDGDLFDEHEYTRDHGDDGWADYVYTLFNGTFMANRYELRLPRPFVALIEKRVAALASSDSTAEAA